MSTPARKYTSKPSTQTRRHGSTTNMQIREHVSTQARQVRDLADLFFEAKFNLKRFQS